jgi:glycosyltransferase involved in cell wall biosynthesis
MPRVTAIVPTYQRPILLERALRSIAAQKVAPVEVIVVDDANGSHTDVTRQVVEKCGLGSTLAIANSHSRGASGARNAGAELSTGELLAFLDDDDEWLPSYLFEALARFDSQGLDMVCADLVYRFDDGIERPGKNAPDRLTPELFLTKNPGLIGSNLIIQRSLYREIGGFDESLLTLEDMDFGLRLSLRGEVRYEPLPGRLVRHYQHTGPRLCTPKADAMSAGVRRFYDLHAHRMAEVQREEFRDSVRLLWRIDERGRAHDNVWVSYAYFVQRLWRRRPAYFLRSSRRRPPN